ncbi:conjugal transfer protein TrbL family protein [Anaerosolibacter sp.]|uniref:conjugal transfer protein TrbL family protein n=1 Tax=Anaerosolibacter sp. TaxID=1872527 RepID=UPI0039EFE1C1
MEVLIVMLIVSLLNGALVFANSLLNDLVPIALHSELYMDTLLGTDGLSKIFDIFFGFGVSLIVLKFLKRGFEQYVLWTDGDADSDPLILLTGFFKALAIAVTFPTLYSWLAEIIQEMTDQLITTINNGMDTDFSAVLTGISSAGIFTAIVSLIFFICFFLLYLQFLSRGLEIFILRVGLPLACVGLMDADKGIFRTYIQKFFQSTLAVMVQIVLAKLGVALMLNTHVFWGLAALLLALRTPRFLQEFLIVSGGHGGGVGAVYQSVRLVQIARSALRK